VVITGVSADRKIAQRLCQRSKAKLINACGKTSIMQFACLLKHCCVFLTVDSAPMHIAAAMRVPFVALFGPTLPQRHLPPARNFIVIKKTVKCSPCYRRKCSKVICMKRITVEEVHQAIKKLLS
jgi:ADP-heptose:LPS heptosyltransferase